MQPAHAARIGMSSERELELAAVVAYWCEGCRSKPYAGCLVVRLRQCRTLYQRIEGTWQGIMGGLPERSTDDLSRVV